MAIETTLGFIKPEAEDGGNVEFIKRCFSKFGFEVKERVTILSQDQVAAIYCNLHPIIFATTAGLLCGPRVRVIQVRGENAVEMGLKIRGASFVPFECDPESVRWILRDVRKPLRFADDLVFYFNCLHMGRRPELPLMEGFFSGLFNGR